MLGGVSLAGGRGGVFGPIVAVVILPLIKTDLTFLNFNSNLAPWRQGVILIGVVMVGSFAATAQERADRTTADDRQRRAARRTARRRISSRSATGRSSRCWCCWRRC